MPSTEAPDAEGPQRLPRSAPDAERHAVIAPTAARQISRASR